MQLVGVIIIAQYVLLLLLSSMCQYVLPTCVKSSWQNINFLSACILGDSTMPSQPVCNNSGILSIKIRKLEFHSLYPLISLNSYSIDERIILKQDRYLIHFTSQSLLQSLKKPQAGGEVSVKFKLFPKSQALRGIVFCSRDCFSLYIL